MNLFLERRVDFFIEIMKDLQSERFSSANLYLFDAVRHLTIMCLNFIKLIC